MTVIYRATCASCFVHKDINARSQADAEAAARRAGWTIYNGYVERCSRCARPRRATGSDACIEGDGK